MSTNESNPLSQEGEVREPTELELLKERARKMGITFSNNIGLEALKQKVAEKQEGKAESTNANGEAKLPGLFSLGQAVVPAAAPGPVVGTATPTPVEKTAEQTATSQDQTATIADLQAKLAAMTAQTAVASAAPAAAINPLSDEPEKPVRQKTLQQMMRDEQTKLVRIRIQNLDPKKKDLHGEIITVANEYLGTIKKFVPYGEASDEGYHVPYCIYEFLKSKRFLNIRTTRDRVTKQIKVDHTMSLEYSIELLPQLTREDLNRLAASQAAAGSLN